MCSSKYFDIGLGKGYLFSSVLRALIKFLLFKYIAFFISIFQNIFSIFGEIVCV